MNVGVLEFPVSQAVSFFEAQPERQFVDGLPSIPVLAETLLAMELLVQNHQVDLHEVAQVVLSDMGATLQIFRLAAQEISAGEDRFERIEDCISSLGLKACMYAIEQGYWQTRLMKRGAVKLWSDARETAGYARMLADTEGSVIAPDQAYLCGLLHSLGALPELLGWDEPALDVDQTLAGLLLSKRWALPEIVRSLFSSAVLSSSESDLLKLVREAQFLAGHALPQSTAAAGFNA